MAAKKPERPILKRKPIPMPKLNEAEHRALRAHAREMERRVRRLLIGN
jgi:hypothetical protein